MKFGFQRRSHPSPSVGIPALHSLLGRCSCKPDTPISPCAHLIQRTPLKYLNYVLELTKGFSDVHRQRTYLFESFGVHYLHSK